jgi:hypothetical protein
MVFKVKQVLRVKMALLELLVRMVKMDVME